MMIIFHVALLLSLFAVGIYYDIVFCINLWHKLTMSPEDYDEYIRNKYHNEAGNRKAVKRNAAAEKDHIHEYGDDGWSTIK